MKKKILIITTGGTIAMKYVPDEGLVPAGDLIEFLHSFPQLKSIAEIDVFQFSNIPSPHMTPTQMFELSKLVDLRSIDYDGVVITHGTDTLEDSCYMLDLTLTTRKPIVYTAAMRAGSELGLDGPRNIIGAVRVACDNCAVDKGVLVVMNDEILAARDVVKTDTGRSHSFDSPDYGILGIIDSDRIIFYRQIVQSDKVWTNAIDLKVDLIVACAGMDGRYIETSIETNAKAIVIEAFGRGNLPPKMLPSIKNALEKKILVVIVSRAYTGRVLPEYGYIGGGKQLEQMGCILGGDLKGHKALIKLMTLFGKYDNPEVVSKFFINSVM
ncbi:MAG: asparaginase [Candidatus Cloacimonetes bacterium]|nr:asparaginase [Candidatus Cloacimonadota bacterium]